MLQNDAFFTHSSLGFFCLVALLRFEVFVWAGVRGLSISWCLDLRFLFARTAGCSKSESVCKCITPASASGKGEGIVCVEQHESGVEVGENLGGTPECEWLVRLQKLTAAVVFPEWLEILRSKHSK